MVSRKWLVYCFLEWLPPFKKKEADKFPHQWKHYSIEFDDGKLPNEIDEVAGKVSVLTILVDLHWDTYIKNVTYEIVYATLTAMYIIWINECHNI